MTHLFNNVNHKFIGVPMKLLVFFFTFILFSFSVFAQGEEGGERLYQCELNFQIFKNTNQYTVEFVATPVWNTVNYLSSHTYIAGANCNFDPYWQGYFEDAAKTISLQGITNLCTNNGFNYGILPPGQTGCDGFPNYSASYFQSGLYYVVVKVNGIEKTNFYYDNRNSQFPSNPCNLPGVTANDIGVRYDVAEDKLYYMSTPSSFPFMGPWNQFKRGEVLNWWEIAETETGLNFNGFQTRYFAILNQPQSINNSPYLTWQTPNVSLTIDHYELQRSWGSLPFQTIYISSSNLSYHDNSIYWVPNAPNSN